jgi:hypothetical protein
MAKVRPNLCDLFCFECKPTTPSFFFLQDPTTRSQVGERASETSAQMNIVLDQESMVCLKPWLRPSKKQAGLNMVKTRKSMVLKGPCYGPETAVLFEAREDVVCFVLKISASRFQR